MAGIKTDIAKNDSLNVICKKLIKRGTSKKELEDLASEAELTGIPGSTKYLASEIFLATFWILTGGAFSGSLGYFSGCLLHGIFNSFSCTGAEAFSLSPDPWSITFGIVGALEGIEPYFTGGPALFTGEIFESPFDRREKFYKILQKKYKI